MTAPLSTRRKLSTVQAVRKAELEITIGQHIASFRVAGEALWEIKEEKLYADQYDTFSEYMEERWGFTERRGYQLIKAAKVAKTTEQVVQIPNEATAREIAKLDDPKDQKKAARILAKADEVNATTAREAVEKVGGPRGGLAAQVMAARAAEPESTEPVEIEVDLSPSTRAKVVRIIQEWYGQERNRLNEYPAAAPGRVVELITRLFQ